MSKSKKVTTDSKKEKLENYLEIYAQLNPLYQRLQKMRYISFNNEDLEKPLNDSELNDLNNDIIDCEDQISVLESQYAVDRDWVRNSKLILEARLIRQTSKAYLFASTILADNVVWIPSKFANRVKVNDTYEWIIPTWLFVKNDLYNVFDAKVSLVVDEDYSNYKS